MYDVWVTQLSKNLQLSIKASEHNLVGHFFGKNFDRNLFVIFDITGAIHQTLNYQTPEEFERNYAARLAA